MNIFQIVLLAVLVGFPQAAAPQRATVIEDFEGYKDGQVPQRWHRIEGKGTVPITQSYARPDEYHLVRREGGRTFVEGYTKAQVHSIVLPNGTGYAWDLTEQPVLAWEWRAVTLPENAREDREAANDAGASLYVTFDADWLGRPRSIKYTYSSTLPAGTVLSYGKRLRVIVVASGKDGLNRWVRIRRNVADDFRNHFGEEPPARPLSIMLRSDTDTLKGEARVHTDDIRLSR